MNIQFYRVPEQKLYEEVVNLSQPKNRAIERVRSSSVGYINQKSKECSTGLEYIVTNGENNIWAGCFEREMPF